MHSLSNLRPYCVSDSELEPLHPLLAARSHEHPSSIDYDMQSAFPCSFFNEWTFNTMVYKPDEDSDEDHSDAEYCKYPALSP